MKKFTTEKICAKEIGVKIENDVIVDLKFYGGCDGNVQGLQNLIIGLTKEETIKKLKGIDCRNRGTSCPDQLVKILENNF